MARRSKESLEILSDPASRETRGPGARSDQPAGPVRSPSQTRRAPKPRTGYWEAAAGHDPTLLIRRTLRSGQRVNFSGNVVVLGDVNPGAEVNAGGDIVVMGWLRGMAHAGADGNERAVVSAFRLNPTQLRIAQYIGRPPDDPGPRDVGEVPERAEVRDGQLVIDRWQNTILGSSVR